ncbi:MAG: hypothetical protein ACOY4K_15365 [Pseudomonadota bacterium]
MSKFEVRKEPKPKRASSRPDSVSVKVVRTDSGEKVRVLSLNANSASFGDDFLYVFTHNVRQARKENKARLGSTSGAKRAS